MFDQVTGWGRGLIEGVLPLYKNTDFAYSIASTMALAAFVMAVIAISRHVLAVASLQARRRQLSGFVAFEVGRSEDVGEDPQEAQFARRFREIDQAMQKPGLTGGALAQAWRRYRKTLTFVNAPPVRSTQRPNRFFYGAVPPPTWLGFSANLFVGFGLLATFLGLVAALTFAADGMKGGDSVAMLAALRDLLSAAASKFVTSIAGVGLSILLSILERILTVDLRRNLDELGAAIELGVRIDSDAHSAAIADRIARLSQTIEQAAGVTSAPGSPA